eukprot:1156475-Pelagomonas_calceolata.AAC.5
MHKEASRLARRLLPNFVGCNMQGGCACCPLPGCLFARSRKIPPYASRLPSEGRVGPHLAELEDVQQFGLDIACMLSSSECTTQCGVGRRPAVWPGQCLHAVLQ